MKILYVKSNGIIASVADDFVFGESDEVGVDKWHEVRNGEQVPHLYYLGDFASAAISEGELPEDFYTYGDKYLYVDRRIVPNPDWHEPEPTTEEKVSDLQTEIEELKALVEAQSELIEIQSEALDFLIMNNM